MTVQIWPTQMWFAECEDCGWRGSRRPTKQDVILKQNAEPHRCKDQQSGYLQGGLPESDVPQEDEDSQPLDQ